MPDSKEIFDRWCDQWDKAQQEGIFKDTPKPPVPTLNQDCDDFFGVHQPKEGTSLHDADVAYWKKVYRLSNHQGEVPDPLADDEETHDPAMQGEELVAVNEDAPVGGKDDMSLADTEKSDKKSSTKITDELGPLANPAHASTRGQDSRSHVTPNWAGGEELLRLHKMKEQLHKLGDKIAADPMLQEKNADSLLTQVKSLCDQIDELSISLNPKFDKEYMS